MAIVTLNYDGRNKTARAILQMIRSLDVFTIVEPESEGKEDPALMSKEDFFAMIDRRMENYNKGEYVAFSSPEEMHRYLESF